MSQVLKLAQLAQQNNVTQMDIRRGRIEPGLDTQWLFIFLAGKKLLLKALRVDDLRRAPRDAIHELINGHAHNEELARAGLGSVLG